MKNKESHLRAFILVVRRVSEESETLRLTMYCSPLGFEHMVENHKPKVGEVGISPTVPKSSRESRQPFVHLVFQMLQRDRCLSG